MVSAVGELRAGAEVQRLRFGTTPAPVDGRYRAGRVTKTFVATVVLQLAGEGRLALSDPVERWLPGLLRNGTAVWGPDRDTLTARVIAAQTRVLLAAFCP